MASNPIVLKDSTSTVLNPRATLLDEGVDKIRGNRGMIIKGFKTEKMRVEEHLRNVNFYFPKVTIKENKEFTAKIKQPEMRYKARTDMERVLEAINKNSFRKLDAKFLKRQLKNLTKPKINETGVKKGDEVLDYKDAQKNGDSEIDDFDYLGIQMEIDHNAQILKNEIEKKMKLINSRKMELNSQARFLIKEFNNKTHFKGVTTLVNFNNYGKIIYNMIK
jgi:hypothetical protein